MSLRKIGLHRNNRLRKNKHAAKNGDREWKNKPRSWLNTETGWVIEQLKKASRVRKESEERGMGRNEMNKKRDSYWDGKIGSAENGKGRNKTKKATSG